MTAKMTDETTMHFSNSRSMRHAPIMIFKEIANNVGAATNNRSTSFPRVARRSVQAINLVARSSAEDLPLFLNELRSAISRSDHEAIQLAAFTIHGLASNFHAKPLMRLTDIVMKHHAILSIQELDRLLVSIDTEGSQLISFLRRKATSSPR